MKKILILTPMWGRPEIVKLFLQGYQRVKKYYSELELVCIISPEDKFRNQILEMIIEYGGDVCEYSNRWLGEKKNAGLDFADRWYEFDYLMDLGSDDLLNPEIFKLYKPYMEKNTPFFGLNNLYIHDWETKRTLYLPDYSNGHTFGAGRMLHNDSRKILPWPDRENDNLDMLSRKILKRVGVHETVINSGRTPYVLDIKSATNIGHFELLKNWHSSEAVEFSEISHYFGLPIYEDWILALQNIGGYAGHVDALKKKGRTDKAAYKEVENIYKMYFGKTKYKDYEVFRIARYRSKHNNSLPGG